MGQVNSTEAPGSDSAMGSSPSVSPSMTSPDPPKSSSIPSVEDMRNITSRILASTNDALKNIRENISTIELPSFSTSTTTKTPSSEEIQEVAASTESATDVLGLATGLGPMVVTTTNNEKMFVFRSSTDNGKSPKISVADLIKIHYNLSVDWVKNNTKTTALGILALGVAVVMGTVAINSAKSYRQKQRRLRVLKAKDGTKREAVVITNVETLEGAALALSLNQEGFVVFVGVPNQLRADEVEKWGRKDIYPVIVDAEKDNPVEDLVRTVSNFLDQHNSIILGTNPASSFSSSVIYEEDLSSSVANIRFISPEHTLKCVAEAEAKRRHHGKTDNPLFRLAAVIVNPHSAIIGSIEKVNLELWRQSIDVNITGTVVATQKFLPLLRRTLALAMPRRSPRLIIVSSAVTGSIGFPYQSAICASHHAIESIADSLRREIKSQGIDVICLRPGISDRSIRSDAKGSTGGVGLFSVMNPVQILRAPFRSASTTSALCEVAYDAITSKKPASSVRVGNSSLSYSFVGWAVPRSVVDWSIKGKPSKTPVALEE
ncbi:hypothetical protein BGX21_003204 [Mortierella sp. AD011]|nr:hypothetical protein BGX20_003273 [Mortierella sp. AD010]KAF9400909.1 hypothetical protein BGX21_003204 [Mortierella sp. AD011]